MMERKSTASGAATGLAKRAKISSTPAEKRASSGPRISA
jgi:hypothetical protein